MLILNILPIAITIGGLYMMFCLKFTFLFHPFRISSLLARSLKEKRARRALALALAGTLGVGNIVGVAVGISLGGAGSVFWIVVSSFFASVLKYSESALAQDMSEGCGGMIKVIGKSFGKFGRKLAFLYAALCLAFSFVMGAALQSASAVECAESALNCDSLILSACFSLAVAAVAFKGESQIEKLTVFIIPAATLIYVFIAVATLARHADRIPEVVANIFAEAFTFEGAGGGIVGFFASLKIREGYSRGLLSNEAGAGTSAMAETRNTDAHPASVGLVGMCEVFFDTVLLCPLTALAVLSAIPDPSSYSSGILLILDSIGSVFGGVSRILVLISIVAFAFSTVACWYYYGSEAYGFIFGKKAGMLFFLIYCIAVFVGSQIPGSSLIILTDYLMCALTLLCVAALIKNSDRVLHLSEDYGLIIRRI